MRVLLLLLDDVDLRRSRAALAAALRARGDEVQVLDWRIARRGFSPLREARTVRAAVRAIRAWRPDVVHAFGARPALLGGVAARIGGARSVGTLTGLGHRARIGWVLRAIGALHARVIAQNEDDRAVLRAHGVDAALIRGSGVDPAAFAPLAEAAPPIVLCAGRLLREKGVREFAAAAAMLRGRARFVLVGAPDPENRGSLAIAELCAFDAVEWWGFRDAMEQVVAGAAIACVPSYGEGLPKALLEAAACGCAIVTTDAPGCREVIRDGVEGLVVPPRDAAALARAIERLLGDPALRARLGRAARARVLAELTDAHVVAQTFAVYDALPPRLGLAYRANAVLRRRVYSSPHVARALWAVDAAPVDGVSYFELGSVAVRRALAGELRDGMRVLDVGTGPYAVVARWAAARWRVAVEATELDARWAAHAAATSGLRIHCGDLFAGARGPFDVAWFVPPFTPAAIVERQLAAAPPETRARLRLRSSGGAHGWELIARFLAGARAILTPRGRAVFAINTHHVPLATARGLVGEADLRVAREVKLPLVPYVALVASAAA